MTKKTLMIISMIADSVDIVTGWVPGPWTPFVDIPVTVIHFLYAGPKAFFVLGEYLPGLGVLPLYTIAASLYDTTSRKTTTLETTVVDTEIVAEAPRRPCLPPPLPRPLSPALPPPLPIAPEPSEVEVKLRHLATLHQSELITEEEYQAKRREILAGL